MSVEIERKFLVNSNAYKTESHKKSYIKQGFLNSDKNRVVRVRLNDGCGYLTIKGKSNTSGTTRFEWEKKITKEEANNLFSLCEPGIIEKHRFLVAIGNHTYEVDEFLGDNKGLVVAEIELKSENEIFEKPTWLGTEVTGDIKYYNSNLIKQPYTQW